MTDYATVFNTDLPMETRRDALVPVSTAGDAEFGLLAPVLAGDFRRVLSHMPYAAGPGVMVGDVQMGSYRDPLPARDVLDTLRNLAVVLMERTRERERMEDELRALKADVRAHRRLLGLAPGGDLDNYGRDSE